MKRLFAVLTLLLSFTPLVSGQKTRLGQAPPQPADPQAFTIKAHISASHLRNFCTGSGAGIDTVACGYELYADAVLNGKKSELLGKSMVGKHYSLLLVPGDYQARITTDVHIAGNAFVNQEYDIFLPDGTVWHCVLIGISE